MIKVEFLNRIHLPKSQLQEKPINIVYTILHQNKRMYQLFLKLIILFWSKNVLLLSYYICITYIVDSKGGPLQGYIYPSLTHLMYFLNVKLKVAAIASPIPIAVPILAPRSAFWNVDMRCFQTVWSIIKISIIAQIMTIIRLDIICYPLKIYINWFHSCIHCDIWTWLNSA